MSHHVFFPQAILDILADAGRLDVEKDALVLRAEGLRYGAQEGVRIIREVTSGEDHHKLAGTVRTRENLLALDAEILGNSMLINEAAYDVVGGILGTPLGDALPPDAPIDELNALNALHKVDASGTPR